MNAEEEIRLTQDATERDRRRFDPMTTPKILTPEEVEKEIAEIEKALPIYEESIAAAESAKENGVAVALLKQQRDGIVWGHKLLITLRASQQEVERLREKECPDCQGEGKIRIGEHLVTRDMARDAGDLSLEDSHYEDEFKDCEACEGTGLIGILTELASLRSDNEKLERELNDEQRAHEKIGTILAEFDTDGTTPGCAKEATRVIVSLREQLETFDRAHEFMVHMHDMKQSELASMQSDNKRLATALLNTNSGMAHLQSEVERLTKDRDGLRGMKVTLQQLNEGLTAQLEQYRKDVGELFPECDAQCPCCSQTEMCYSSCTFCIDSPEGFKKMTDVRRVRNVLKSQTGG